MATYLSILRGINVSGQKMIKMADLKALYEAMGFKNITTYIQSGNVIFESKNHKNMAAAIEQKIKEQYGFDVPVIIRNIDEIKAVIEQNPFLKDKKTEPDKLHVTYLSDVPTEEAVTKAMNYDYTPDSFVIKGKEVYVYCPNGYGNTKLNNTFFENKLKVKATTRNWKTTNKLFDILISNS